VPAVATKPTNERVALNANSYDGYYSSLSGEQSAELAKKVSVLQWGTSFDSVQKSLGPPDQKSCSDVRFLLPRQHRSTEATYFVARYRKGLMTQGRDQMIVLWFDADDRLEMIYSNFPGVESREANGVWDQSARSAWWNLWLPHAFSRLSQLL
jgi:hypothetical protein